MQQPIVIWDSPILSSPTKDIDIHNVDLKDLSYVINDLIDTLRMSKGLGLAAPQIAYNHSMFVAKILGKEEVFINPKIIQTLGSPVISYEGCLSLPTISVKKNRSYHIKVEYYNSQLIKKEEELMGMGAFVFQHELDHLLGKLMIEDSVVLGGTLQDVLNQKFSTRYETIKTQEYKSWF